MQWFSTRLTPLALLILALALTACDSITGQAEIADLETKNAQLQGTLNVVGTPMLTIAALEAAATQNVLLQVQIGQAQGTALAAQLTLAGVQSGGGGLPATSIPSVPPGDQSPGLPTTIPTPNGSQTRFSQTVTSTGLNADDCPIGSTSTFDQMTPTIYVNTQVDYLPSGSVFGARWTANGTLFFDDAQCWTPDKDWYNICAYCSIVPDDPAAGFTAGSWTVELLLDGQVLAQVQFTVTDSATATPEADTSGSTLQ
jgi:hypothetical protein